MTAQEKYRRGEKGRAWWASYLKSAKGRAVRARNGAAWKERTRQWMTDLKREQSCIDCGTNDGTLEFDHLDPSQKLFNIGHITRGRAALLAEIAKCVVRCGPCHRKRYAQEQAA
jgi:hypothetical protein